MPQIVQTSEGSITTLEVKVIGKPKPEVKWLREDEEIVPSEEYQIENKPDGTSVLVISNVYPDDTGKISFEAHNSVGVAETATELIVGGNYFSRRRFILSQLRAEIYLGYGYLSGIGSAKFTDYLFSKTQILFQLLSFSFLI